MADAFHHATSSAHRFGGAWEDYIAVHRWFDSTKAAWCDQRHRAVLHSSFGIDLAIQVFGQVVTRADGKQVPVRWIAEQHIREDCGFIPTLQDWLSDMPMKEWMLRGARRHTFSVQLERPEDE